jgi:hypothetical protein
MLDPQSLRPEGKIIAEEAQATQQREQTPEKKGYRGLESKLFGWQIGQKSGCYGSQP